MAKLAPSDLAQVLGSLPAQPYSENLLVGFDQADDAGAFRVREDLAILQTVDFFTPVADDPEIYGRVAAVNSLNDIYAMGGTPISALGIVCFPQSEDLAILGQIMRGGQMGMNEDGVIVIGGHTVDDKEIKFGYAVTGVIHPDRIIANSGARAGDALILTKAVGTGAISTGIKNGVASRRAVDASMKSMTTSAKSASIVMQELGAHACTDVTGFGLLGHAYELAKASNVCLEIDSGRVPLLPDVLELIAQGMLTRGDKNNRAYVGNTIEIARHVSKEMQSALFDPQTAGGLLISIDPARETEYLQRIEGAIVIGNVKPRSDFLIRVF